MISLVNSARIEIGKPPLGFINTALYQTQEYFVNDIIYGKNSCTGDDKKIKKMSITLWILSYDYYSLSIH